MRILHFNPINNLAGASRSMCELMRVQARQGPTYAIVMHDNELADLCRETGAEVRTFYGNKGTVRGRLRRFARTFSVMRAAIRDWDIDLVHVHSAQGMRYVYLPARLAGKPIVCHQRDNYARDYFHAGLGKADRVIAISKWVQRGLPAAVQNKSTVIYNSVDAPVEEQLRVATQEPVVVGYAGRCVEEKGIDLFVESLAQVDTEVDFRVVIWGVPPKTDSDVYGQHIHKQLDNLPQSLRERIDVQPFRRDIENFYRSVDVVVVPSRFAEPMGRMAIEAMAWRCLTIVADHGGLSEIVHSPEIGATFRPGDSTDLADKLGKLLVDDSARHRIASAGRLEAINGYSANAHATAVAEVYRALLN